MPKFLAVIAFASVWYVTTTLSPSLFAVGGSPAEHYNVSVYRTTNDLSTRLLEYSSVPAVAVVHGNSACNSSRTGGPDDKDGSANSTNPTTVELRIDISRQYQQMDGFGFALTDGSAVMIASLPEVAQDELLSELFDPANESGIHVTILRVSIGASDLSASDYTLDETPSCNETDDDLANFSIDYDRQHVIPLLKKILTLQPSLPILATPWTAPPWMKSPCGYVGGTLQARYYQTYANYFVKYIQAMAEEGIVIDAVTPQNEPIIAVNNPSMSFTPEQEAFFIKSALGPAFRDNNISTNIWCYEDSPYNIEYPLALLGDAEVAAVVDGVAFHFYSGSDSNISAVHEAYPDVNLYLTERGYSIVPDSVSSSELSANLPPGLVEHATTGPQSFAWQIENIIVGSANNWLRNVIEWDLASNEHWEPHVKGGCANCQGAVTIDSQSHNISRDGSYYVIAQVSKFVPPGSIRVNVTAAAGSEPGNDDDGNATADEIASTAFLTPTGNRVVVAVNTNNATTAFPVAVTDGTITTAADPIVIEPQEAVTFVLPPSPFMSGVGGE